MLLTTPSQVMYTFVFNTRLLALLIACLFYNASTFSNTELPHTTAIPDSNFEQALIALNIDTNGLNGNILNSDAMAVTTLFLGFEGVADLTGIEAFGNLVNLYAYNNNIISADFSQNLALEIIDIENNKVSSLNVANNSVLKELLLSNNHLTTINVSDNLQLEYLSCNLNSLNVIDVAANINLKVLRCYSNNLSTINLNSNTALEMLFISDNNLNSLNVTLNTGLETLTFDNNNINTIDLSENTNLEYLGCSNNNMSELDISLNTSLTRLLCNNNALTEISLSNAPDLFLFYVMNNQIQSLDLVGNSRLRFFRAENNLLTRLDIRNDENDRISEFVTTQNPNLSCIFVDDSNASFLTNWEIDEASNFVQDDSQCETLTVKEDFITDFMVYPNPANDHVNIVLNTPQARLKMYTIKGQLILEKELTQGTNSFNISDFSSGLYVVAIQSEGAITTKKLVIN